jgi:hypothetical protein
VEFACFVARHPFEARQIAQSVDGTNDNRFHDDHRMRRRKVSVRPKAYGSESNTPDMFCFMDQTPWL